MTAFLAVVCGVAGLVVGSFLNVVVHRLPRSESLVTPRSRCPSCGTPIAPRDNVPVVSWLLLRGRCRHCHTAISARYPAVEALTGALFAAVALRLGADAVLPAFLVVVAGLVALSAVDLERYVLPNRILYPTLFLCAPLFLVAAAASSRWDDLRGAALGGVLGFALIGVIHLAYPAGMGFGDVRLSGLIGVPLGWLGLGHVLLGLFGGFLLASLVSVGLIVAGRRGRKDRVPFGPFLAAGAILAMLFGVPILEWYAV